LLVDLETKLSRDESADALHHSLSRCFAAHVDVAIVRVSTEAVTSTLQLLVQLVEHKVRQKRRQDAPNAIGNFEFDREFPYERVRYRR
jgi:hypothetical protein